MHETKILAALRENYRSCTSYEDAGTTQNTLIYSDSVEKEESEFSTIFIRPNLLKFQSKTSDRQMVVQANGESIRELHYRGGQPADVVVYPTLDQALGAMEGVSLGVLSVVFGLLENSSDNNFYTELKSLTRLPDTMIDETECHCISGEYKKFGKVTIWAAKETNVLRRIEQNISEEASHQANKIGRLLAESEGESWEEFRTCSTVVRIDFKRVTFNNSITIDAIG